MYNTILTIIKSIEGKNASQNNIPPTLFYNEGWLLRLVLQWLGNNPEIKYKLSMKNGARWFSEALLPTIFYPLVRGDSFGETYTHADGVYGDIIIGNNGKGDVSLKENCGQFCVIEAKMYNKYSKGVTHSGFYNQVARTVACRCKIVSDSKQNIDKIGFYTLLPNEQIKREKTFKKYTNKDHILDMVRKRVCQYTGRSDFVEKENWYKNKFITFIGKLDIKLVPWEDVIAYIKVKDVNYAKILSDFYERCKDPYK